MIDRPAHTATTTDPADPDQQKAATEVAEWTEHDARQVAAELGVQMTDAHWRVVRFLRDYYHKYGTPQSGRVLATALGEAFADAGGKGYLHQLFPDGPVAQGCRIGGLPVPMHTEDVSFGTAM